ncbi:MAG: InlB B-repeat-containing protein [Firmicutes bacterium]|nr:InlB B-repeat-containing protein [Bacillota bacterium]
MSVLIVFFLVACSPGDELDVDALLLEAEQQVELAGTVTSNITLPTTVVVEELTINVTWSSSNTAVISNTGVVTRPSASTGNVSVTLTATFTYLEEEKVGTFVVVVEALPAVAATVTFNSNEGSSVTAISTTQGSLITAPTPPTKANHTFGGWYKEAALTNVWNFATDVVNANLTLYAKWVENESAEVTFNKGNGEDNVVVSVYTGQKVTAIEDPSTPGYTFSYWSKADFEEWDFDVDLVTEDIMLYAFYEIITYSITYIIPEGAELSSGTTSFDVITPVTNFGNASLLNHEFLGWFTAATGGTKVTSIDVGTIGNQTLYAQFEEDEKYIVTFNDMNGGITTENLYYGYVDEPTDPIRSGYLFLGWFKDMEGLDAYDFEFDLVSQDITLYAMWEKLVPEGMTGVYTAEEFYQMTLHAGTDAFFLMNPIDFSDYTWVAHNNAFKGIFDGDHQLISNLTIESTNSANYGGIFPRANGATIQNMMVENLEVDVLARAGGLIGRVENGKVTLQDISIHKAHVKGTANEGVALLIGQASFEVEIHNVSISGSTAFSTNKYASLFIGRADVVVTANDIFIRDSVAEITATNTDASASGIVAYTNADAAHVTVNRLVIVDSYLHGKYSGAIVGYLNRGTVTVNHAFIEATFTYFDAPNSGLVSRVNTTGVAPTFTNLFVDLNFETPTHAQVVASSLAIHQELDTLDLQFWLDHLSAFTSSSLWASNVHYYKLLNDNSQMIDKFEVSFNVDGGTPIPSYEVLTGSKAFVPLSTTKAEHIFDGFYKDALLTTPFDLNTEMITSDTTIYVKWIEMDKFDVTFNSNGGTSVLPLLNVLDSSLILEPAAPTRLGYTFAGWYKDMELTDDFAFTTDMILEDMMLYAKWEVIEYTISYHLNGGEAINPLTYTIETPTFALTAATKLGYTFTSWTNAEVAGVVTTEVLLGTTGNLDFYAQYVAMTYSISYMLDGGTLDAPNPTTYQITSETLILNNASKDGYDFDGWYDAEVDGMLYTEIVTGSTGNITLYARFYELVNLNFYDEQPVNITNIQSNTMYPNTMFALSDQHELFVMGNNDNGLVGDGTNISKEYWVNATGFFGLMEDELILSVQLTDYMAIAHTSENRIFIWGLFNVDEDMDVYSNEPLDITQYFDFTLGTPQALYNFGRFFIVETTDSRILVYENMVVTDITPVLGVGEVLEWAPNYGFTDIPYSTVIYTGSRVLMLNPYDLSMFYDVTMDLNLPVEEDIYAVLSQEFAVHVLTESKYNFATFTGDEMNPVMALNIDLTISFNPLESITMHFGAGGFVTSEGRLLVPMYIVEDEESEMPNSVIYHDVTADLMLEVSETIVGTFDPFFVMTSLDRILMIQIENNFTDNPLSVPALTVVDMELEQVLEMDEYFMDMIFVGYELFIKTNKGMFSLIFGQETLELEALSITTLGLVYSDIYSVNELDNLYQPMDRMYEDFAMWYIDPELTTPLSIMNVHDEMNLYAGWERTHYFIEFQFYVPFSLPKMAVEIGQAPIAPADPMVDHQIFNGWYYYDEDDMYQSYDFSYAIDHDVVMYSNFSSVQYDVTFQFETEDPIVVQAFAYTYYGDLSIEVPAGYEVVAVYLDEDMLIPFDPDLQVLGNITLYVAIDQMIINIYYYHDTEDVVFENIFATDLASYGFTNDGRVFAWGSNNYGGLGIGMLHINQINTPFDITPLLNLSIGEEITQTYAYYSTKVFITSLGRVLAWGYPDPDYNYYDAPQDITSKFNFQMGEEAVDVYLLYNSLYLFTDFGSVYIFDFVEDSMYNFTTTLDFLDVLYLDQFNFELNNIVIIIPSGAYQLSSSVSGDAAVETEFNMMFTDEIFKVTTNFQAYNQFFVYTREGRVYIYNHNDMTFVESFDLSLNEFETLDEVFEYNWDLNLYYTSAGRLYKHLGEGVTTEFDLSELAVGEKLVEVMYGSGFYTSYGNAAYMDTTNLEISFMNPMFVLGLETVIYYQSVDFNLVAYTSANTYVTSVDPVMEFKKTVGIDLMVEQYLFGDPFMLAVPTPKMGYDFVGWVDDYQNPYLDTPTNDVMLYASWSETIE